MSSTRSCADGVEVRGWHKVGLCAGGDRTDPAGQGLIAFFTVNPGIGSDRVGEVADLVAEWDWQRNDI